MHSEQAHLGGWEPVPLHRPSWALQPGVWATPRPPLFPSFSLVKRLRQKWEENSPAFFFFFFLRARAVDSDVPVANLHSHKYQAFPESLNIKRQRNSFGLFFFYLV